MLIVYHLKLQIFMHYPLTDHGTICRKHSFIDLKKRKTIKFYNCLVDNQRDKISIIHSNPSTRGIFKEQELPHTRTRIEATADILNIFWHTDL